MSIAQEEWFKVLKRYRIANITARKRPKKPQAPYQRLDPEERHRRLSEVRKQVWQRPDIREKAKKHPWRQNYPQKEPML